MTQKKVELNEFDMDVAGYKVAVRRHPRLLTLNGYVGVPKGHLLYGVPFADLVSLHGITPPHKGFSYSGTGEDSQFGLARNHWFFGFDTAHKGDFVPGTRSFLHRVFHGEDKTGEYKTLMFVKQECSKVIAQFGRLVKDQPSAETVTTVQDDTDDTLFLLALTSLLESDNTMPLPDGIPPEQVYSPFEGGGGTSGGAGASGSWEDAPAGTTQPNAPETPDTSFAASMADLKESLNQHTFTTPNGPVADPTPANQDDDSGYSSSPSSDDSSSSSSSDDLSSSSGSDYSDSSSSSDYSSSDSSSSCDSSSSDF